jgi:hypothetical protein
MGVWIFLLTIWSGIGFGIILGIFSDYNTMPFGAELWEFVNPVFIYRSCRVNWFGAIVVAALMSLACPLGTFLYWCYKICTIGRKFEEEA